MPSGPKPKPPGQAETRRRAHQWKPAPGEGWQHGDIPTPPEGLKSEALAAWDMWFKAWWASFWTPNDLAGLELTVELYDKVRRGDLGPEKLTPYLDRYGITEKGRQDNRWAPVPVEKPAEQSQTPDEVGARREKRTAQVS